MTACKKHPSNILDKYYIAGDYLVIRKENKSKILCDISDMTCGEKLILLSMLNFDKDKLDDLEIC